MQSRRASLIFGRMSIWEYANPKRFMQLSHAALPWVAGLSAMAGTTGGGCNRFCGEVHRLPLDLCQRPGGLAAIVGDGCAL